MGTPYLVAYSCICCLGETYLTHPTVQGGVAILKPNTQKKIRIFAEEGQFSEADRAKILMFEDSEDLNLKSHARASQSEVKNILQNCAPTSTVEMHFELETEKKPKLHLASFLFI